MKTTFLKEKIVEQNEKSIFTKCVNNNWLDLMLKQNLYLQTISGFDQTKLFIGEQEYIAYTDCCYLGLGDHPQVKQAMIEAIQKYGSNYSSSRILGGTMELHLELERKLAEFIGGEDGLVYALGYMANLGAIASLVRQEEFVIIDNKCHASIIDGCKLSSGRLLPYHHNDMNSLERCLKRAQGKALVVVDGVFSMEGTTVRLDEVYELCEKYHAGLMVDDAHGFGLLGENGRGTAEHFNLLGKIDLIVGTLSKTIPCIGGFVVAKESIIRYLKGTSRPFIFTVSLPPHVVSGAIAALEVMQKVPQLRINLLDKVEYFAGKLITLGYNIGNPQAAIVPVKIGSEETTFKMAHFLRSKGIFIDAPTYPAVRKNEAILRFVLTTKHSLDELDYTVDILKKAGEIVGII